MAGKSPARPAGKPAAGKAVSKAHKTPAKTIPKTSGATTTAKAVAKTAASIAARKATIAATMLREDPARLIIDDNDEAALAKIRHIKRSATERLDDPPPATGAKLIARVTRAIERELTQIETIVGGHHIAPRFRTEAERRARTLASLARTLSEVTRLRAQQEPDADDDAEARPRDLDEFRETLARRLEQMVAAAADRAAGGDEPD